MREVARRSLCARGWGRNAECYAITDLRKTGLTEARSVPVRRTHFAVQSDKGLRGTTHEVPVATRKRPRCGAVPRYGEQTVPMIGSGVSLYHHDLSVESVNDGSGWYRPRMIDTVRNR